MKKLKRKKTPWQDVGQQKGKSRKSRRYERKRNKVNASETR